MGTQTDAMKQAEKPVNTPFANMRAMLDIYPIRRRMS